MYKVCVADDERYIRISIEQRLAMSTVATRFGGSAADGPEALLLYRREQPDIFFVDIRMPGLSGLEVIRAIRSEYPDSRTKFIVVSGYDDFAYLQQSIRLGVMNYIKKPVVQEELDETLRLAVEGLDRENRSQGERVAACIPLEELAQRRRLESPPPAQSLLLAVYARQGLDDAALGEGLQLLRDEGAADRVYGVTVRGVRQVAVLYLEGFNAARHDARSLASRIRGLCGDHVVYRQTEGETLQQAMELLESRLNDRFAGAELAMRAQSAPGRPEPVPLELLKLALERGQAEDTRRLLRQILTTGAGQGGVALGAVYRDIVLLLLGVFAARRHPAPRTLEMELLWFALARFPDLEEVLLRLGDHTAALFRHMREAGAEQDVIDRVCAYLDEHYADDISLQMLADSFFVSPTYLSKRFKEKRGITITGYLEELRLGKARELLGASALSISDVCALVGYNDANYFSRLFRKRFGKSPSAFRQGGAHSPPVEG